MHCVPLLQQEAVRGLLLCFVAEVRQTSHVTLPGGVACCAARHTSGQLDASTELHHLSALQEDC